LKASTVITLTSQPAQTPVIPPLSGAVAEQYYALVHWLRAGGDIGAVAPKTLGVTSCARGAGVSTVAMNLAAAAAQSSERPVLLLDLSAVRLAPQAHDRSVVSGDRDTPNGPGGLYERVEASSIPNLSVLRVDETVHFALGCECRGVADLVRSLEDAFGFIVVDLPNTESSICFTSAGLLHGVLLVIESERTDCRAAARAKQVLNQARANVLGVILNKHVRHLPRWLEKSN
jgi:Mrp family chromosome partitioning ATPase